MSWSTARQRLGTSERTRSCISNSWFRLNAVKLVFVGSELDCPRIEQVAKKCLLHSKSTITSAPPKIIMNISAHSSVATRVTQLSRYEQTLKQILRRDLGMLMCISFRIFYQSSSGIYFPASCHYCRAKGHQISGVPTRMKITVISTQFSSKTIVCITITSSVLTIQVTMFGALKIP